MTKKLLIIGIGAGDPEHLTIQAINALNQADVFFVMDKGVAKTRLKALRKEIIERYVKAASYRVVQISSPERNRDVEPGMNGYRESVHDLNRYKQTAFEALINHELQDGQCGAVLVWGDPALYDSTIRIVGAIMETNPGLSFDVIPGITSIQALTARHRVPLNSVAGSVQITTGRTVANGLPDSADSVVVMLDAQNAFRDLAGQELDIYWGAYVGMTEEILISGKLDDVMDDIERVRAEARANHGWIMDSYLLRKRGKRGKRGQPE